MAIMTGGEGGRDAGVRARGRDDVFPGLQAFFWTGILAGLLPSIVAAGLLGRFDRGMLNLAGMGAGLGAILGLFIGLARGVWRAGLPLPARDPEPVSTVRPEAGSTPTPQLWDPWLDAGRDLEPAGPSTDIDEPPVPEVAREEPVDVRAAVRPRVISPQTGEAITLEDEIGPMLQDGRRGLVVILGGPGSGKTTALRHLAAILPPWARGRVRLLELLDLTEIAAAGPDPFVILALDSLGVAKPGYEKVILGHTNHELSAFGHLLAPGEPSIYRLAPWDQDDAIEYLLATDRDACASVMGRLARSGDFHFLDGIPELWSSVLDRMARDESIGDVRTALRSDLSARIGDDRSLRSRIGDYCLDAIRRNVNAVQDLRVDKLADGVVAGTRLARIIRHRPAALLLAADSMAEIIEGGRANRVTAEHYPRDLVQEAARQIAGNAAAIQHLGEWFKGHPGAIHPLAASLLHAATPGWRPDPDCRPRLEGAYLDGVVWPGVDLSGVFMPRAELRNADLSGANLDKVNATRTNLHGANLQRAILNRWVATEADLGRANLRGVRARHGQFLRADLTGACLIGADLWKADLRGAQIADADFSGANLEDACLRELSLTRARIQGARFGGADLHQCDLEDVVLMDADFHDADLRGALLTGSRMPDANFVGADLRAALLAEIDWPGACLRDADLRGVNFHLGSTRSGKLDSPIPCEGSRTGFYTEDFLDREVKPAEEIRKANLRGADLRGANIRDVDFYLVDLRDARYTADQAEHLRRCQAILDDRTA